MKYISYLKFKKSLGIFMTRSIKFYFSLILFATFINTAFAQDVTITVNVQPPFSPYLSDYTSDPNKVFVTLISTTEKDVYLHGSIESIEGVNVHTKPGFKQAIPIHLSPGMPYILNIDEVERLYTADNVIFEGIDENELMQTGQIPEGTYEICIKAYDYETDLLVSGSSGCSTTFLVTNVEAPMILNPQCGTTFTNQNPLVVNVTWSVPANVSPDKVYYHFRMIEIPKDSNINPVDALTDPTYASIFEQDCNINSIILTNNDVNFTPDNIYVFNVWVGSTNNSILNPANESNTYYFSNNGLSEACWFEYVEEELESETSEVSNLGIEDFQNEFELIPRTHIGGRMFYKLPDTQHTMSLEFNGKNLGENSSEKESLPYTTTGFNYNEIISQSINFSGDANENNMGYLSGIQSYTGPKLINSQTIKSVGAQPLANTEVRLVARLVVNSNDTPDFYRTTLQPDFLISGYKRNQFGEVYKTQLEDLKGNVIEDGRDVINIVLDRTTTDAQGNYSFNFRANFVSANCLNISAQPDTHVNVNANMVSEVINDKINSKINPVSMIFQGIANSMNENKTQTMSLGLNESIAGLGFIGLKVEVVNQKFCAPDVVILAMPGDQIELGDEVSLLKTYSSNIIVKSDATETQMNGKNKKLANSIVKVLRKADEINKEHPIVIAEEAQKLKKTLYKDNIKYKVVAEGITNDTEGVYIENLVNSWQVTDVVNGPYFLSVSTRKDAGSNYENTIYNYEDFFDYLPNKVRSSEYKHVMTNHFYKHNTQAVEIELAPKNPEIKARLMTKSNSEVVAVSNAKITLFYQNKYEKNYTLQDVTFNKEASTISNESGFFRFTNLSVATDQNKQVVGPYRRIKIVAPGYKEIIINPQGESPYNLIKGQLKDLHDIFLEPANILKGEVIDELGNPVIAYLRQLPKGPYYKTENINNKAYFDMAVSLQDSIEIEPLSSQYFTHKYKIATLPKGRKKYVVYKKLHRLSLHVLDKDDKPIANAGVKVGDDLLTGNTDKYGVFQGTFTTPDAQFVIKISAENYAPKQKIINLPVSKDWVNINVIMDDSFSISGVITDETTGNKVKGAKVFAQLQNTDGHQLYIEAITNENGTYILKGIPNTCKNLELHIIKEGNNPSYIGKKVMIQVGKLILPKRRYDYSIRSIAGWDLTDLMGFPMQVEKLTPSSKDPSLATLNGFLYNLPTNSGYKTQEPQLKAEFYSIKVTKDNNGKVIPVSNEIALNLHKIPLKINETFNGVLEGKVEKNENITTYFALKLIKDNPRQAHISERVKLDLESFRFAYEFGGDFYISENINTTQSVVYKSNLGTVFSNAKYYVFDIVQENPVAIADYKVFGFKADAVPEFSILKDNRISLKSILHTAIPLKEEEIDLKLPIGNIVISKNEINIEKTPNDELKFKLEKWNVHAKKSWIFDKNEEAIIFPNLLISSDKGLSVNIKNMRVRYDALREGDVNINKGLTLGGFYPVKVAKGLKPIFNYDPGVGHYRISVVGETSEDYAASISNLPKTNKDLHFTSVALLSDDSQVLSLHEKMRFYNIIDITVDQIMSGDGFFKFSGTPDLGIPGFIPTDAVMHYSKNDLDNPILEPLNGFVECSHDVNYILDVEKQSQHISDGLLTLYGDIKVKPSANEPGEEENAFDLRGFLSKTNQGVDIDVIKVDAQRKYKGNQLQFFKMGSKHLLVYEGNMQVDNQAWSTLNFKAKPDPKDQKGMKDENVMSFVVNGNLSANGDGIKMDNISEDDDEDSDSPFSKWVLAYNFSDSSLRGSATILPMSLGYVDIRDGLLQMLINPNGFYFGAQLGITYSGINIDGGLIVGYTTTDLSEETKPLLYKFRARGNDRPDFTKGLKGFYFIGEVPLLDNKSIPLVILTAYMDAGLGVWVNCNFETEIYKIGGYSYFNVSGSVDAVACEFGICLDSYLSVQGGYENGTLTYESCGNMDIDFKACLETINTSAYLQVKDGDFEGGLGSSGESNCSRSNGSSCDD